MSNRKVGEKPTPRKSKVSSATGIDGGLGGPKRMAKAARDGQLVDIPALSYIFDGGTECSMRGVLLDLRSCRKGAPLANPGGITQAERKCCGFGQRKLRKARFREKLLSSNQQESVPQNQHRWVGRVDQGERVKAG